MKKNSILILCLFIFFSCKTTDEVLKTRTELLTIPTWKLTGFTISPGIDVDGNGVLETDLYNIAFPEPCMQNSTFKFNIDSTYVGNNICSGETYEGHWQFNQNQTVFYMAMIPYNIENLNEINFTISISYLDNSIEYTQTRTYTAQ